MSGSSEKERCPWGDKTDLEKDYHDREWGVPCITDRGQFEFLILESAQAGLSWSTILRKREGYRAAFADFDPEIVVRFTEKDVLRLMDDASIVRNRKKIESAIKNARCFLDIVEKHGSFCSWFWKFSDGRAIVNCWDVIEKVPPTSELSHAIAKEMKRLGFSFLGPTAIYAHMQATGMVNDHLVSCFRHAEVQTLNKPFVQ